MVSKCFQLFFAVLILLVYCVVGILFKWTPMSPQSRRWVRVYFTHYISRLMLKAIRVKTEVRVLNQDASRSGKLIVANHTSVLDIMILAARSPCVFVTSVEVEENFILEFLARTGGTIFIERRVRSRIDYDREQIRQLLLQGFDVVLFPEGTSTNGTDVLRFKSGLFPSATEIRAPIEPVSIRYVSIAGEPVSELNRDRIYYYGDHFIGRHLFNIFTNEKLEVKLQVFSPLDTSPEQEPKVVAETCREMIRGTTLMQAAV